MNAEVAYAYRERKAEAEPLGEQAYHLRAVQNLKLKTVVKVGYLGVYLLQPENSVLPRTKHNREQWLPNRE